MLTKTQDGNEDENALLIQRKSFLFVNLYNLIGEHFVVRFGVCTVRIQAYKCTES